MADAPTPTMRACLGLKFCPRGTDSPKIVSGIGFKSVVRKSQGVYVAKLDSRWARVESAVAGIYPSYSRKVRMVQIGIINLLKKTIELRIVNSIGDPVDVPYRAHKNVQLSMVLNPGESHA